MNETKLNQSNGYLLEFQESPYDRLCGCVSVPIPYELDKIWDGMSEDWRRDRTKRLIRSLPHARMVEADCPKCGGSGLIQDNAEEAN